MADVAAPASGLHLELAWLHEGQSHCVPLVIEPDPARASPLIFAELLQLPAVRQVLPPALLAGPFGLAVYGRRRRPEQAVEAGDRIEIVPPLLADPKESRRQRVEARRRTLKRDRWHTT